MTIAIATCPQCGTLVLNDTPECVQCHHVFDRQMAGKLSQALPTDAAVADDLERCRHCGETYRKGLVRCWSCGSFTQDEIAASYAKMVANHGGRPPLAVELQEVNIPVEGLNLDESSPVASTTNDDDQDFELSASDNDFDFELADSIELGAAQSEPAESDGGYRLQPSTEDDAPPPVLAQSEPEAAPTPIPLEAAPAKPTPEVDPLHAEHHAADALLNIAKSEEVEVAKSQKQYREKVRGGFVVFCPMGCRIRVQDKHRGKTGRCPKCNAVFIVPLKKKVKPKTDAAVEGVAAPATEGRWRHWTSDAHLHSVNPTKLRIKPDSLLKEFVEVDLAFSSDGLLLISLITAPGFMGANLKKKPTIRTTVQEHLKTVGTLDGLPAPVHRLIPTEALGQLSLAQPTPPDVESLFGNIPVFGTCRIAVKLPKLPDDPTTPYLSFSLSEFRAFSQALADTCGLADFGAGSEVPLTDAYGELKCHYSDAPVRELLNVPYYQADKSFKLKAVGWRCGGCGLVVSEDSRKKEKIGGLNGKGIAKAKCPKCQAKFGNNPLYELEAAVTPSTP